jgi:hypothetical protein
MAFINISTNRIDSYILVVCQDRSKGLVGLYVKTTLAVLLIYILNMVWVAAGPTQIVQDRNLQNSKI